MQQRTIQLLLHKILQNLKLKMTRLITFVLLLKLNIALGSYCCLFDDGVCDWKNTEPFVKTEWKWSGDSAPDNVNIIPNFKHDSEYVYLQDPTYTVPVTAVFQSPTVFINLQDLVTIQIYRHVENYDGSERPVVNFVSLSENRTSILAYTFIDDQWTTISQEVWPNCCSSYPCLGYFEVAGKLFTKNEILAFDSIILNGCEIPKTSTTAYTQAPTVPTRAPTEPTQTSKIPTHASTELTLEPTKPTEVPTEQTAKTTEKPTEVPTEHTAKPTEKPTEPSQEPTEATQEPTQEPTQVPTQEPSEPTEAPTRPTSKSTQ